MYLKLLSTLLFLCTSLMMLHAQEFSNHIHVDQFGYRTEGTKVAVLSDPQVGYNAMETYTPAATMQLVNSSTSQVVFTAAIDAWDDGATHDLSGDKCWWFDFSEVESPGSYYVYDAENELRSAIFEIAADPYAEVLKQAGRAFYYNRCNAPKAPPYAQVPWTDGDNFSEDFQARYIEDPTSAALSRDVSGGWFDAGDYNKYVTFTYSTIHNMLSAYQAYPEAFTDDWDIPESGNGIPDVLDEVIWELQWLERMYNADGSVHVKAGSQNYSDNTSSPPSANTDPRFYGPTCTAASATVASVFAHASQVLSDFTALESYADILSEKAIVSFDYCIPFFNSNTLETDCDDGSIVAGDADREVQEQIDYLLDAAVRLLMVTGDESYEQFISAHYGQASIFSSEYFSHYDLNTLDSWIAFSEIPTASPTIANAFAEIVTTNLQNNYESMFGFNALDPYRGFMPDYSYHWGSNSPKAALGALNAALAEADLGDDATSFRLKATEQVHYFHGVNPLNLVYLSNMYGQGAEKCVNEMYHTWFYDGTDFDNALTSNFGPAPGFIVGGPNNSFSIPQIAPPYGQPAMKSYLDYNTGFPDNSWEISEPAIYYQAAYLRLLASQVSNELVLPNSLNDEQSSDLRVYPNPFRDELRIESPEGVSLDEYTLRIRAIDGKELLRIQGRSMIEIQSLAAGTYLLEGVHDKTGETWTRVIEKQSD